MIAECVAFADFCRKRKVGDRGSGSGTLRDAEELVDNLWPGRREEWRIRLGDDYVVVANLRRHEPVVWRESTLGSECLEDRSLYSDFPGDGARPTDLELAVAAKLSELLVTDLTQLCTAPQSSGRREEVGTAARTVDGPAAR